MRLNVYGGITMKYTREDYIAQYNQKSIKYIFFWGHTQKGEEITKTCFSQWYPYTFIIDNVTYHTTEQYMMVQKALLFNDTEIHTKLLEAIHPKQFKELGRKIRNFNEDIWVAHRYNIVLTGNIAKFSQNQDLKNFLLTTNKRVLVEASPHDQIWGIGLSADTPNVENPNNWKGLNLLGFALMEVRDIIGSNEYKKVIL